MKILVFLGTVRDSTPPKPARLGERVSLALMRFLQAQYAQHAFELIDALDYRFDPVFKPHFAYSKRQLSDDPTLIPLDKLATTIKSADGYIMISPEYNHSMSPALANLLNHFGSSLFSYKPSAIVTYSAGQWGGMRAAVGMRTFLAELGCLSVSAMIHVPSAQTVFMEDGELHASEQAEQWQTYFARTVNQLLWWANATKKQRTKVDPLIAIGSFQQHPSQRNAP